MTEELWQDKRNRYVCSNLDFIEEYARKNGKQTARDYCRLVCRFQCVKQSPTLEMGFTQDLSLGGRLRI